MYFCYLSPINKKWLNTSGCPKHWTLKYISTIRKFVFSHIDSTRLPLFLQSEPRRWRYNRIWRRDFVWKKEVNSLLFLVFSRWKIINETKSINLWDFVFQNNILKIHRSHIKSPLLISSLLHSRNPNLKLSLFFLIILNLLYSFLHFDSKCIL